MLLFSSFRANLKCTASTRLTEQRLTVSRVSRSLRLKSVRFVESERFDGAACGEFVVGAAN